MTPTTIAILSLFAWIVLGAGLFAVLSPRRAVLAAYLGAWLFLPVAALPLPGLPDLTKSSAATAAVVLGAVLLASTVSLTLTGCPTKDESDTEDEGCPGEGCPGEGCPMDTGSEEGCPGE